MSNQEDRIRKIFGLTTDDPMPDLNSRNLTRYRAYLSEHLSFPLHACFLDTDFQKLEFEVSEAAVVALDQDLNVEDGILCTVVMENQNQNQTMALADLDLTNRLANKFVQDYHYWFEIADPCEDEEATWSPAPDTAEPSTSMKICASVLMVLLVMLLGGALGSIMGAMEYARISAAVGGVILGGLFCIIHLGRASNASAVSDEEPLVPSDLATMTLAVTVLGAFIGALLIAFVGTLVGIGIGFVLGRFVFRQYPLAAFLIAGAVLGATLQAFWWHADGALTGLAYGSAVGAIVGIVTSAWFARNSGWLHRPDPADKNV